MSEWIRVKERLPKDYESLLTFDKCVKIGAYNPQLKKFVEYYHDEYILDPDVTHWMPLPEPPKDTI